MLRQWHLKSRDSSADLITVRAVSKLLVHRDVESPVAAFP